MDSVRYNHVYARVYHRLSTGEMMTTLLFIWVVSAAIPGVKYSHWEMSGVLYTEAACANAAKSLSLDAREFRCVVQATGELVK